MKPKNKFIALTIILYFFSYQHSIFSCEMTIEKAYEILKDASGEDINYSSNNDDIKKAYKKALLKWHPDKNPDQIDKATENTKWINAAYEMLITQTTSSSSSSSSHQKSQNSDQGSSESSGTFQDAEYKKLIDDAIRIDENWQNNDPQRSYLYFKSHLYEELYKIDQIIIKNPNEISFSPNFKNHLYFNIAQLHYEKGLQSLSIKTRSDLFLKAVSYTNKIIATSEANAQKINELLEKINHQIHLDHEDVNSDSKPDNESQDELIYFAIAKDEYEYGSINDYWNHHLYDTLKEIVNKIENNEISISNSFKARIYFHLATIHLKKGKQNETSWDGPDLFYSKALSCATKALKYGYYKQNTQNLLKVINSLREHHHTRMAGFNNMFRRF